MKKLILLSILLCIALLTLTFFVNEPKAQGFKFNFKNIAPEIQGNFEQKPEELDIEELETCSDYVFKLIEERPDDWRKEIKWCVYKNSCGSMAYLRADVDVKCPPTHPGGYHL